jgi:AcrR family transcriptional regulator
VSPRPRKATDQDIFAATQRVMMRLQPAQVTLAEIAAEAGLTAGALVQRFGSKRELLVAVAGQMQGWVPQLFAGLRAAHRSPLDVVRAYGDCMAAMGGTAATLAHHLSWLQLDFTDPDMRRHLGNQAQATLDELEGSLGAAVAAGELPPGTDPAKLAQAIQVVVSGSLMVWAFYQRGSARDRMRQDIDVVLAAFGAKSARSRRRKRP